jgi:hypothetical protein
VREKQPSVVLNQFFRGGQQLVIADQQWHPTQLTTLAEAGEMFIESIELVTKCADQIGDGGAEDKAGVGDRDGERAGQELAVVVGDWLGHGAQVIVPGRRRGRHAGEAKAFGQKATCR